MKIKSTIIEDTFAEAFGMRFTRLVITAINRKWVTHAVNEVCGYGSSVISCDAEAGFEAWIQPDQTLDGRPGASVLLFAFSTEALQKAIVKRAGQCLMTCPTTAVFDGMPPTELNQALDGFTPHTVAVGDQLRFFGDGFQKSKLIGSRRFWRVPVMDGEFICEDKVGVAKGVAGGNLLILSTDQVAGLAAAQRAVDQIEQLPNVITPFPGGVVRSGSKVGSRYKALIASTSHPFCPTLKGRVESKLPDNVNCVYEIVIDGTDFDSVGAAVKIGVQSAVGQNIPVISAGNYGGKLGKHHYHLRKLFQ